MNNPNSTAQLASTPGVGSSLFIAITKDFPPPWRLEYHEMQPWYSRQHVSRVVAANGECPVTLETHSGDGDMFNLGNEGAEALVRFVNAIHAGRSNDQAQRPDH